MSMLHQSPLPAPYPTLTEAECVERIRAARAQLGARAVILTHHYQRPEVVALGDVRGDSLKLAQFAAAQEDAEFVVYCGVHFMAESADVLKRGQQKVVLPDLGAGCDMADMADADDVEEAWNELVEALGHDSIMPVTYINSTAALKAFVGAKGGVCCTSTNAARIIDWALTERKTLFFFPDQHLGRNTCKSAGIPLSQMTLWEPGKPLGGNEAAKLRNARVFLWKGHCPVHAMFTLRQIENLRAKDPAFKVISHPECAMEVVDASDAVGSTEFIVSEIAKSPAGSKWAVGTEMNLVNRIATENPGKTVVSINPFMCLCGTMNRIDLPHLAWALDSLVAGTPVNVITVEEPERSAARATLDRMLAMSVPVMAPTLVVP
ncbi:MAG: quinolinate synthase NadA [Silvanigrellales bacterium]|nr:quinolinate synthase NadA [Silvanigrellales bacterium]